MSTGKVRETTRRLIPMVVALTNAYAAGVGPYNPVLTAANIVIACAFGYIAIRPTPRKTKAYVSLAEIEKDPGWLEQEPPASVLLSLIETVKPHDGIVRLPMITVMRELGDISTFVAVGFGSTSKMNDLQDYLATIGHPVQAEPGL